MGKRPDLRQRKQRSDLNGHHKTYAGRPVKGKRQIRFERKRGNKSELKLWVWQRVPRTMDSALKFSARVRPFMARHPITMFRMRHDVATEDINCKEKIEYFFEDNYWAGEFLLMGCSHGKTRTKVKWVKLCRVLVRETPEGIRARMINNYRMNRYWFWRR